MGSTGVDVRSITVPPLVLGSVPFEALGLALAAPGLGLVPGSGVRGARRPRPDTYNSLELNTTKPGRCRDLGLAALTPWLVVALDLTSAAVLQFHGIRPGVLNNHTHREGQLT